MEIKKKLISMKDDIVYICKTIFPLNKKKIYILNTPLHINIGDSTIVYAQNIFLKELSNKYKIVEVTSWEVNRFEKILKYMVKKKI